MTYVIAEIGINHNGDRDILRRLISAAALAGCDAVKFQKRSLEHCYTPEELDKPRDHPWGTTNRELKERLELHFYDYHFIDTMCREFGLEWFASPWDIPSVDFLDKLNCDTVKIPSALITDLEFVRYCGAKFGRVIMSTGMSTAEEVDEAIDALADNELWVAHCTSCYPCKPEMLNLRCVTKLYADDRIDRVGYSGHEVGLTTTYAAVALGATFVERHLTLDRSMFGSDQAASIEPQGMAQLVKGIKAVEAALGDGIKRVYDEELPVRDKLRRKVMA